MIRLLDSRVEYFIGEDIPYVDLTSTVLGLGKARGRMEYFTREQCILAGIDVCKKIVQKLGLEVVEAVSDGSALMAGDTFLVVEGACTDLHAAWKVCLNVFDHLSAVATKTKSMVDAAHKGSATCEVLTTRKSMPGVKDLLTEAVMIGGAFPHRLGLSETVLVFDHHIEFMGGFDAFMKQIPEIKSKCVEKKLFVECDSKRAVVLANAGVDGLQFDKIPTDELTELVTSIRQINPGITLIAAGGINPQNAQAYAQCGVDGLATTAPFTAKPLDMSIRMHQI